MSPHLRAVNRGRLFAFVAACSYGSIAPLAGLAYQAGASPGAVIATRLLFGLMASAAVVAVLNRPWHIPRREWFATGMVVIAWLAVSAGYMASFFFIPVSLAVLVFFTFPVLIALAGPMIGGRRPEPLALSAALLAFTGLALALGPDIGGLDWRGCALAVVASLGATAVFLISERLVVEQDLFSFNFHLHLACVLIVAAAFAVFGMPAMPAAPIGWLGLAGVGLLYVSAALSNFGAIRLAGPARASLVFNVEPVIAILGAAVMLGELLGLWQLAGAILVIGAVFLSIRVDRVEP